MLINSYNGLKAFFLISICVSCLSPQISDASDNASRPPDINRDITQGIELLYDREFDIAEKLFHAVITERPEDPTGYFYLAMVTWSQLAAGFWSPVTVREYGERIDRAISVARDRIKKGKADSFTYFYLGGSLGFKGRFQLMQRKWISSFFLAMDAIDALKTCRKLDPANRDVLLGLGTFDYYTARLSGALKFLSYLLIHKGDKKEGLRKMNIAANEALYSAIEAKSMLLHIYLFMENNYNMALSLAEALAGRFDKEPRFRFFQGVAYIRLGMDYRYREVVGFFYERGRKEALKEKVSIWNRYAIYLEACYYLFHNQYDVARSKLESILSQPDPEKDPFMLAWPLLKIGMSHDLEGEREKALEYYNRIIRMKNSSGAQFLAQKYINKPAKKRDPFLGY